jgi:hypothetical protein
LLAFTQLLAPASLIAALRVKSQSPREKEPRSEWTKPYALASDERHEKEAARSLALPPSTRTSALLIRRLSSGVTATGATPPDAAWRDAASRLPVQLRCRFTKCSLAVLTAVADNKHLVDSELKSLSVALARSEIR